MLPTDLRHRSIRRALEAKRAEFREIWQYEGRPKGSSPPGPSLRQIVEREVGETGLGGVDDTLKPGLFRSLVCSSD